MTATPHHPAKNRPGLLLTVTSFVAFVSLGLPDAVLGVAWPSIRRTFALSLSQLGPLLAAGVAGYLLSSFFAGQVVRRIGLGNLLLVSSALVVASLVGYAAAPAWPWMLLCGVPAGLGAGAIDAGINAYAADRFRPTVVTWLHASYGIGATLGPLTMTAVIASGSSWQWGYAALAAMLAVMAALFVFTRDRWAAPPAGGDPAATPAGGAAGTWETLRQPGVQLNVAIFFLYTGVEVTAGQWLYSLFTESRGVAPVVAGAWVGAYWAMLTLGRVTFGAAAARYSRRALTRVGMAGAPVAAAMIWLSQPPLTWVGFAGAALLGFHLAPIYPLLISATPDRLGRRYSTHAIGFQVSAATLGVAAVPGAAGVVARWTGLEVIGPFLLAASLALLLLHELALRVQSAARGEG